MQINRALLMTLNSLHLDDLNVINTAHDLISTSFRGTSLFEMAIVENNESVIDHLLCFPEIIEFFIPLTPSTENAKYMA